MWNGYKMKLKGSYKEKRKINGANTQLKLMLSLKKSQVEPLMRVPYLILVCSERPSAFSIGVTILSTVRKAARLAVYELMTKREKSHQNPPTMRVEAAAGDTSEPVMYT